MREHGHGLFCRFLFRSVRRTSRAVAIDPEPPQMTDRSESFREDVRFKVLRMLEGDTHYSQRDIADALGVSLGGVNYCLKALIQKGYVKVANFRHSNNKLRYAYVLTPSGIAERTMLTGRFLQRKMREYDAIKAEIDALMQESAPETEDARRPQETARGVERG
jgi:EPS-associated MarR family transcriptional regulator